MIGELHLMMHKMPVVVLCLRDQVPTPGSADQISVRTTNQCPAQVQWSFVNQTQSNDQTALPNLCNTVASF